MARKKAAAPPQEDAATPPGQPPPPPPVQPVLMFKKKLNRRDVTTVGGKGQVVVEEYREEMKTVLDNLVEEKRYFFLRINAEDPLGIVYELRFAYYDAGNYAVFHQWGDVVTLNHLREGYTVECWGNFVREDEIRATLHIHREMPAVVNQPPENPEEKEQESPEKPDQDQETAAMMNKEKELRSYHLQALEGLLNHEGYEDDDVSKKYLEEGVPTRNMLTPVADRQIPAVAVENRGPESEPDFLFEKKLDYADIHPGLDRLVFTRCSEMLKTALEITPHIRVSLLDPNNNVVEHTPMLLTRYVVEDRYTLCREWRRFVANNALKVGDSVLGRGNFVGGGELIRVQLYIRRDEERKADEGRLTLLLLGKDPKTVLGRVVIDSTSKEVAEVVVAREGIKMKGYEEDEGVVFARISTEGSNGVEYDWSEAVGEDGLIERVDGVVLYKIRER